MPEYDIWNFTETNENICEKLKDGYRFDWTSCFESRDENGTFFLDLTKDKYSLLEKYVYDISTFHIERLRKKDIHIKHVEFWCKRINRLHRFHVDCDEELKSKNGEFVHPELACVTYLNDSDTPTLLTNIDPEKYMYKTYENMDTDMSIIFPRKNKTLTMDGKYYHGVLPIIENSSAGDRYIIAINLWNECPSCVSFFPDLECDKTDSYDKTIPVLKVDLEPDGSNRQDLLVSRDILNKSLLDEMLYGNIESHYELGNAIQYCSTNSMCYNISREEEPLQTDIECSQNTENIALLKNKNSLEEIKQELAILKHKNRRDHNRFLQRFQYHSFVPNHVCKWIINESENFASKTGGWTINRHEHYPTTDLQVKKITTIFPYALHLSCEIFSKIIKSYCLPENTQMRINDMFIVKYNHDQQNELALHQDGSTFSFNILLNPSSEFEGGGTYFDDGLTMNCEQGDICVHHSGVHHSGLPITKGSRYLLVGFIDCVFS